MRGEQREEILKNARLLPVTPERKRPSTPIYVWALTCANLALIALVLLLIADHRNPAPVTTNSVTPPPLANVDDALDMEALNPYGLAIAKAGLRKCAMPMNELSRRLLGDKKVGVYRFPTVRDNFVSLSMEVTSPKGAILYITFDLSQSSDGSCQIAYEVISDWANSCDDLVTTIFQDFVTTRTLLKSVALLTHKDNKSRKVFTMPVQNGCIAIEKEVVSINN
jgi:hypothetical protein